MNLFRCRRPFVEEMKTIAFAPKHDFSKLLHNKAGFVSEVYMLLAAQLAVTAAVIAYLRDHAYKPTIGYFIPLAVGSLLAVTALVALPMQPLPKVLVFTVLSVMVGMLSSAASDHVPGEAIQSAVSSVAGVFVTMTVVAVVLAALGVDLSFMAFSLLVALIGLIVALVSTAVFYPKSSTVVRLVLTAGVVLFSVFIAFDTNVMLLERTDDDVAGSALALYLDIINLFSEFIGLRQ